MAPRGRHIRTGRTLPVTIVVLVGGVAFGMVGFAVSSGALSDAVPAASVSTFGAIGTPTTVRQATTTVSAAPTSTARPRTTSTTRPPRAFSMAFTGDLLIHSAVRRAAASHASGEREFDFRPLLEPIRPLVEDVDWAVCHLEVNLSVTNDDLSSYPRFRAPRELAADVRDLGFDSCTTASNHTMDYGAEGVETTIEVLEAAGLRFTGTARSWEEQRTSRIYEIKGVNVHHLAYTYWFNGLTVPEDQPWLSQDIDRDRILADAADARAAGADFVMVSLHWGEQYENDPNPQQSELGPELLGSPEIDLIIGHHAHVVQRIDRVGGEWLVYGLGNLMSGDGRTLDELLVRVDVSERDDGRFEVDRLTAVPLHLDPRSLVVSVADEAARDRITAILREGSGWPDVDLAG